MVQLASKERSVHSHLILHTFGDLLPKSVVSNDAQCHDSNYLLSIHLAMPYKSVVQLTKNTLWNWKNKLGAHKK